MKINHICAFAIAAFSASVMMTGAALAQDATGTWKRDTGSSNIRISSCGEGLCGTISWLAEPRNDVNNPDTAKRSRPLLGTRMFSNMVPNGAGKWKGQAYNPEDGKTYNGNMSVSGNTLTTQGCVLGGMICRSAKWTRVN